MSKQSKNISKFGQTFISYGSYHYNNVNKIIHIICIPIIAITLFALLTYVPYKVQIQNYSFGFFHFALAFALIFYLTIHPLLSVVMGVLFYIVAIGWQKMFQGYNQNEMFTLILVLQIVAWALQFVGHGVFEKRKPALLDNIFQIFSAPVFVLIELFDLIGIRTKSVEEWKVEIKKNVDEFHSKRA